MSSRIILLLLCCGWATACVPAGFHVGDDGPGSFGLIEWSIDDEIRGLAAADFLGRGGTELLVATPDRVLWLSAAGSRVVAVAESGEFVSLDAVDPDRDGRSDLLLVVMGDRGPVSHVWSLGAGGAFLRASPIPLHLYAWPRHGLVALGAQMGIGAKGVRPLLEYHYDPSRAGQEMEVGDSLVDLHPSMADGVPIPFGSPKLGVPMVDRSGKIERIRGREVLWSSPDSVDLGISSLLIERAVPGMLSDSEVESFRLRPPPAYFELDNDLRQELLVCRNEGKEIPILANMRTQKGASLMVLRQVEQGGLEEAVRQTGQAGKSCAGVAVVSDDWGPLLLLAVRDRARGAFRKASSRILSYRVEGDRIAEAEEGALSVALEFVAAPR